MKYFILLFFLVLSSNVFAQDITYKADWAKEPIVIKATLQECLVAEADAIGSMKLLSDLNFKFAFLENCRPVIFTLVKRNNEHSFQDCTYNDIKYEDQEKCSEISTQISTYFFELIRDRRASQRKDDLEKIKVQKDRLNRIKNQLDRFEQRMNNDLQFEICTMSTEFCSEEEFELSIEKLCAKRYDLQSFCTEKGVKWEN